MKKSIVITSIIIFAWFVFLLPMCWIVHHHFYTADWGDNISDQNGFYFQLAFLMSGVGLWLCLLMADIILLARNYIKVAFPVVSIISAIGLICILIIFLWERHLSNQTLWFDSGGAQMEYEFLSSAKYVFASVEVIFIIANVKIGLIFKKHVAQMRIHNE